MAETPRRIEIPAGSPLGQILRDGITTAGDIREGDLIVYANPPAAPSVGEPEPSELTEYDRGEPEPSPHCVCGHRLDRHLHTLPAGTLPCLSMLCWCSSFRAADPAPDRPPTLDDFARLLALGATAKGTYLTPDQSLALRSSLEEARKDSTADDCVRVKAAAVDDAVDTLRWIAASPDTKPEESQRLRDIASRLSGPLFGGEP